MRFKKIITTSVVASLLLTPVQHANASSSIFAIVFGSISKSASKAAPSAVKTTLGTSSTVVASNSLKGIENVTLRAHIAEMNALSSTYTQNYYPLVHPYQPRAVHFPVVSPAPSRTVSDAVIPKPVQNTISPTATAPRSSYAVPVQQPPVRNAFGETQKYVFLPQPLKSPPSQLPLHQPYFGNGLTFADIYLKANLNGISLRYSVKGDILVVEAQMNAGQNLNNNLNRINNYAKLLAAKVARDHNKNYLILQEVTAVQKVNISGNVFKGCHTVGPSVCHFKYDFRLSENPSKNISQEIIHTDKAYQEAYKNIIKATW
jgi:hypothetical protein